MQVSQIVTKATQNVTNVCVATGANDREKQPSSARFADWKTASRKSIGFVQPCIIP
jgi:hypothetical protein